MPALENDATNKRGLRNEGRGLKEDNWQTLAHFVHFRVFSIQMFFNINFVYFLC